MRTIMFIVCFALATSACSTAESVDEGAYAWHVTKGYAAAVAGDVGKTAFYAVKAVLVPVVIAAWLIGSIELWIGWLLIAIGPIMMTIVAVQLRREVRPSWRLAWFPLAGVLLGAACAGAATLAIWLCHPLAERSLAELIGAVWGWWGY